MMNRKIMRRALVLGVALLGALALTPSPVFAPTGPCADVPSFDELSGALSTVAPFPPGASEALKNGGLNFNMWATVVNRDGVVCAVAKTGPAGAQWPGSRVISAQKANTANAFSLPGFALSTANLFSAVQPGGSLFGLQESNPVDHSVAYRGAPENYGQPNDPMVGGKIGGINVFGGGLALYNSSGSLVGGIGVSGDTSCTDHIVAWKVRFLLTFDNVPAGVSPDPVVGPPVTNDNIIHDITPDKHNHPTSAGGFGHPTCLSLPGNGDATSIAIGLPGSHPVGD